MSLIIATDTSANLPTEFIKENDIKVVAFPYFIEGEENHCVDINDFDGPHFYEAMKAGKMITTSQINPQSYYEFLEDYAKAGDEIILVSMSSGISGSFNSARIAKEDLLDDYPDLKLNIIDSLGASLGEGILVYEAVKLRKEGKSLNEICAYLEEFKMRVCQIFTVDDLMYLKRTGRISNAAAVVGNVLQIKPLLKGSSEGQIVSFSKARNRKRAIEAMVNKYFELAKDPVNGTVYISHAGEEDVAIIKRLIDEKIKPAEYVVVWHEPATGSHVGPGMLAIFFEGIDGARER